MRASTAVPLPGNVIPPPCVVAALPKTPSSSASSLVVPSSPLNHQPPAQPPQNRPASSTQHPSPVDAKFSPSYHYSHKNHHPYSSISAVHGSLAVAAAHDTLHILQIHPQKGLCLLKVMAMGPYFQLRSTAAHPAAPSTEARFSMARIFEDPAQNSSSTHAVPPPRANSLLGVNITDLAWSPNYTASHSAAASATNSPPPPPPTAGARPYDDGSLLAVAGSNGMVLVWNAATLLGADLWPYLPAADSPRHQPTPLRTAGPSPTARIHPEAVLSQHARAVNRVAWHPHRPGLLLSASQDGFVLLWERNQTSMPPAQVVDPPPTAATGGGFSRFWGGGGRSAPSLSSSSSSSSAAALAATPVRPSSWSCRATFEPKCEAVRDVQWSPFHDDVFAVVTNSGHLLAYHMSIPAGALFKMAAHGDATSLDWHPTRRAVLATGGGDKDRTIKIWDVERFIQPKKDEAHLASNANSWNSRTESDTSMENEGSTTINSSSSSVQNNLSRHKAAPLHVLFVSAPVTRLKWRPPALPESTPSIIAEGGEEGEHVAADPHESMLAVATAPIKGASAGGSGLVALWSWSRPFMAISVLEGHLEGSVTDFQWLDTPKPDPASMSPSKSNHHQRRGYYHAHVFPDLPDESEVSTWPHPAHDHHPSEHDAVATSDSVSIWQHVLTVGRDGRCLIQSFARGDRPLSRVPSSCFAMANLSPYQRGYGSLQVFSVCQSVPSRSPNELAWMGLRRDMTTARAPGVFREVPHDDDFPTTGLNGFSGEGISLGSRIPSSEPQLTFNVVDQGDLDAESKPADDSKHQSLVVNPEVVHFSRFAARYLLYPNDRYPTRVAICLHNAEVAESLQQDPLAFMWRMVASFLENAGLDGLPDSRSEPMNVMQYAILPTFKALLEERGNAGDIQTCVALCEVLQVFRPDQTVRIPGLAIDLVREWYLSYIDILRDMCLFSEATELIRSCQDPFISSLNQQSTTIHESCPYCGKATDGVGDDTVRRACKSCRRRVGLCFICHEPVTGVYVWCPGCGHGGHLNHAWQWFFGSAIRDVCPTGCGHRCNALQAVTAFPRTDSLKGLLQPSDSIDIFLSKDL